MKKFPFSKAPFMLWFLAILLLLPAFAKAEIYYDNLGLLKIDTETTCVLKERFPALLQSSLMAELGSVPTRPDLQQTLITDFVIADKNHLTILPTYQTPPGTYSLPFFDNDNADDLYIISFTVERLCNFSIEPSALFLDGFSADKQEFVCTVKSNGDWQLFVHTLGDYPGINLSAGGLSVKLDHSPRLIASGNGYGDSHSFVVEASLSEDPKNIPANYYVFPLIFTLTPVN